MKKFPFIFCFLFFISLAVAPRPAKQRPEATQATSVSLFSSSSLGPQTLHAAPDKKKGGKKGKKGGKKDKKKDKKKKKKKKPPPEVPEIPLPLMMTIGFATLGLGYLGYRFRHKWLNLRPPNG